MVATQTASGRKPSRPIRRRGGLGRPVDDSGTSAKRQKPLPFMMSIMNDPAQPMALRAQMAKAALPYLHTRGEEQEDETVEAPKRRMSDLELARRIAHILELGRKEEEKLPENERTLPPSERAAEDVAAGAATTIARDLPPPAVERPASRSSAPIAPADERWHYDTSDPHPGYRWI